MYNTQVTVYHSLWYESASRQSFVTLYCATVEKFDLYRSFKVSARFKILVLLSSGSCFEIVDLIFDF